MIVAILAACAIILARFRIRIGRNEMSHLERGLADIALFNCGRRPCLTEHSLQALVLLRFGNV